MTTHEERDEEERRKVGAVGWAMRANRARSAYGWWGWLFGGTAGEVATMIAAIVLVGGVGGKIAWDGWQGHTAARELSAMLDQGPRRVERKVLGDTGVVYAVSGRDSQGRLAAFDLVVLSKDHTWALGRTDRIERAGAVLSADDFKRTFLEKELGSRLAASRELIAIGLASAEGEQKAEEARAAERGKRIAGWLTEAVSGKPVWALSLGQYRGTCQTCDPGETDWQRPIIVVGVTASDEGVDLAEALTAAMETGANLPKRRDYSQFTITRTR